MHLLVIQSYKKMFDRRNMFMLVVNIQVTEMGLINESQNFLGKMFL